MSDLEIPERGYRQLRKGRWSVPERHYFITTNLDKRRELFNSPAAADIVKQCVQWMEDQSRWTWISYVIMPDHFHLVLQLGRNWTLSQCMKSFKTFTSRRIGEALHMDDSVWQEGFFDHCFRSDEKFFEVLFYVYWNPVKAGLAGPFQTDYPHWACKEPY